MVFPQRPRLYPFVKGAIINEVGMLNCASEDQNPICVTRRSLNFTVKSTGNVQKNTAMIFRLTVDTIRHWHNKLAQYTAHMLLTFYIAIGYWDSSKAFKFGLAASPIGPGSKLRPKSWKESEGRTAPPIAFFLGVPSHFVFQDPNVFEGGWRVFGEVKW